MRTNIIEVLICAAIDGYKSGYGKEINPLIGRRYKVGDNSYIKDLATGIEGVGLYGREVIIVSEPYAEVVHCVGLPPKEHLFVKVFSTDSGRDYRVLFNESWLID